MSDPAPIGILIYRATWVMGICEAEMMPYGFVPDDGLDAERLQTETGLPVSFDEDIKTLQDAGASIIDILTIIREVTWVLIDEYSEPDDLYETDFGEVERDKVWLAIVNGIVGRLNARQAFELQAQNCSLPHVSFKRDPVLSNQVDPAAWLREKSPWLPGLT